MEVIDASAVTFLFGMLILACWEPAATIIERRRRHD